MPLGLGFIEILLALAFLGAPIGLLVLAVRILSRRSDPDRHLHRAQNEQLTAELDYAQRRLEDLEARLERTEKKAAFTEALLDRPLS